MPHPIPLRRLRLAPQAVAPAAGGDVHEVSGLRAYPLREPVSRRSYTVIRLETKSGIRGYGECGDAGEKELALARQAVTGRPATAFEVVRLQLAALPGIQAAVNMALLDIVGKIAKAPVYQVLGGPTRNKARALAPLHGAGEDQQRKSMERALRAGFRAFSVPVPPVSAPNHGQALVREVKRRLEVLRAAAGPGSDFVLDAAGALTPSDAAMISQALERFHLLWFDEPCPLSNLGAVRKLSAENVTPLGFGRAIHAGGDFQDLLRENAADILRPSLSLNGLSRIRRMAALAETYYIAVAPYHDGGPIGTAAALHLAASLPNFSIQQIPLPAASEDGRMRAQIVSEPVEAVKDGFAALPTGPGLGITVNEKALENYSGGAA